VEKSSPIGVLPARTGPLVISPTVKYNH
jgi:hypothetical protein